MVRAVRLMLALSDGSTRISSSSQRPSCLNAGGTLPEGWDCAMRFRITSRRHGRKGLTTDNYYYSPCGKTFRTHKQVGPNQAAAGLPWSSRLLCAGYG